MARPNNRLAWYLLSLTLISASNLLVAGPLEDAQLAIRSHDYSRALRLLTPIAGKGNAEAQYNLAML